MCLRGETVEAYDGICDKQYNCYRLYNYVYERVEVFEKMKEIVATTQSSAGLSSSPTSSNGARVVKVGGEEFDLRAMVARLRKEWNKAVESL